MTFLKILYGVIIKSRRNVDREKFHKNANIGEQNSKMKSA